MARWRRPQVLGDQETVTTIHDAVLAHLEAQHLATRSDADGAITFAVDTPYGSFDVRSVTDEAAGLLVTHAVYPHFINEVDVAPLEDYLRQANLRLRVGNFELETDPVVVRCKTSIDFAGTEPSAVMIGRSVGTAIGEMVRHMPGIASVVNGLSVELAISSLD